MGGRQCNAAGSGYAACECGGPIDAGVPDAGPGADMPDSGMPDAGMPDAGMPDAGAAKCQLSPADGGASGCRVGQKCSWVDLNDEPEVGEIACVTEGTVLVGDDCTAGPVGPLTGFDNCVAGAVCIGTRTSGKCRKICAVADPTSCGAEACVTYSGLFSNAPDRAAAGACTETCNPLTQMTSANVTCGVGKACYVSQSANESIGVCGSAGSIGHGRPILAGSVFLNSCVPGAMPRFVVSTSTFECGGLCAPAEVTSTMNQSDEGGISPNSCQARWGAAPPSDATAGESCVFWWSREPTSLTSRPPGRLSNTLGFCFKHVGAQYDSDGDEVRDAPWPRCTSLTTGDVLPPVSNPAGNDALDFGCLQKPVMKRAAESVSRLEMNSPNQLQGWR